MKNNGKRVKTPTVLQMEAVECGAASLCIILSFYHRYVSLEELRIACGISRDGSKVGNILSAASTYGMQANGFNLETNDLKELKPPFIVFWNFNHFLVVEGFKGKYIYLNDPARGPRKVTEEEFNQSFTGVVLTITPGTHFKTGGIKPNFLPSLIRRLKNHKTTLTFLFLTGITLVIPGLLLPVFSKVFVDGCLVSHMNNYIAPLLIGMVITAIIRGALTFMQKNYLLRFKTNLALQSAADFFWHILRLPVVFYSQRYTGDIASRVAINDQVAYLLSNDFLSTVLSMVTVLFYTILMFFYNVPLTFVAIFIACINLVTLQYVARIREDGNKKVAVETGKLFGSLMIGIQTIETIKASGTDSHLFSTLIGRLTSITNASQEMGKSNELLLSLSNLLLPLNIVMILGFGGYLIMQGEMSVGTLVAFQSLTISFMTPFNNLIGVFSKLQQMHGSMNRLDDVLKYPTEVKEELIIKPNLTLSSKKIQGKIEFKNVTFGYNLQEPPLFEKLNFTVEAGQWIGVIGSSHSGRSTLAHLLVGLYKPWSGEILIDDQPISFYSKETLSRSLGFVSQEIVLFDGTILDNLRLWDTSVSEEAIVRAAEDAEIHSLISNREKGYQSEINTGGLNFSGGERQRMEIARSLAHSPSILVLDDATSALDPPLENRVYQNLRKRSCTVFLIAQRLSAVRDADQIIVIDQGKIIQHGNHDRLIKQSEGLYAQLVSVE